MVDISSSLQSEVPLARCAVTTKDFHSDPAILFGESDVTTAKEDKILRRYIDREGQLFGREKETQEITAAFQRCCLQESSSDSAELVLLSGESGSGKSSLSKAALQSVVTEDHKGYYLVGKFDQLSQQEPYAPFVQAFNDLMALWEEQASEEWRRTTALQLKQVLSEDYICILQTLIPALSRVFPILSLSHTSLPDFMSTTAMGREAQQDRLKTALQRFLRVVCSPEQPVVFVLDDCQWSSQSSLVLLQAMVSSFCSSDDGMISRRNGLMVVAICRREEVSVHHEFADMLRSLEEDSVNITHIQVEPLSLHATNQLVSSVLGHSLPTLFSERIHKKTNGNVFYLHQYLLALHQDGSVFDDNKLKELEGMGMADLVASHIRKLPAPCQRLLQIAAVLGADINMETLRLLWNNTEESDEKEDVSLDDSLQEAIDHGFLQRRRYDQDSKYSFCHDQMQLASYNALPKELQAMAHLTIGRTLFQSLTKDELGDKIFLVVNQMIHGVSLLENEVDKYGLAALCLQAGKQSTRSSDFASAIYYFQTALGLLPQRSCWRDEYHLCLDLNSSLAEATCATANFDLMDEAVETVLAHATRSVSDTARAYTTRIYSLSARLRPKEALGLGKEVVAMLGVNLPPKPGIISFLRGFMKVKRKLGKFKSDDDILNLHDIDPDDRNNIAAMTILSMMATCTYTADESDLYPAICFAMISISLKDGLSAMSSHAFCLLAVVLCAMDDFEGAYRYSMIALKIINRYPKAKAEWLPRVSATIHGLVGPWKMPIAETYIPLLQAHAIGRDSGDLEFCVLAGHFHSVNSVISGRPLHEIEKSHNAFYTQMVDLKHETWLAMAALLLQFLRTLIGTTDNPRVLQCEMPEDESKKASYEAQSLFKTICQMQLSFHYDDLDVALDCLKNSRVGERTLKPSPLLYTYYLYAGMTSFKAARTTKGKKRRAHIGVGRAMTKQFERLAKVCPENFQSSMYLLQAELLDAQMKRKSSVASYRNAIDQAEKFGFNHISAMARESYGLASLRQGEISMGKQSLKGSIDAYRRWGALAIATYKEGEYSEVEGKNLVVRSWQ